MKTAVLAVTAALGVLPAHAWSASDLVFEPAYFEQAAPVTAFDMVARLPGFVIDSGDAVRGYAGAAGNVLVDGVRPSTKNRTLDDILKAIPASQVARIELIRTARPGLDQKGAQLLATSCASPLSPASTPSRFPTILIPTAPRARHSGQKPRGAASRAAGKLRCFSLAIRTKAAMASG
ncbi:MAG: hypothetical protein JNL46_06360 [Sphingosinicella sp.]|nr:hypothetical protein [Sphingosinicella sp.]